MVAIDKMVEQKAKEMIEKEAKKENNDPKVEKKSRFSHLAERQECWNDEFQVLVVSKLDLSKIALYFDFLICFCMNVATFSKVPKPVFTEKKSISDPEPPRKRFEVKTASQQVAEILARKKKIDAKE